MDLASSSYYYRVQRSEAKRIKGLVTAKQMAVLALTHNRYGVRRMTAELQAQEFDVNRKRVYRLMQEHRLLCKVKRGFVVTTDSLHGYQRYPNLYENII